MTRGMRHNINVPSAALTADLFTGLYSPGSQHRYNNQQYAAKPHETAPTK